MIFRFLAAAALALGCTAAAPEAGGRLELVDLTDDFDRIWTQTADLPDAERATAFKAGFAPLLPGFYDHVRLGMKSPDPYDRHLLRGLKNYPERRAGIADVSARFTRLFDPALASFEKRFGPMTGYPPIYLVNSLGEFDGGTRLLPEGMRLLFGADQISRNYQGISTQPFIHHELFHLLHNRTFPECDPVWCALWTEGLAVHAALVLNPKATDAEMLLNWPEPLRAAVDDNRALAVCLVRARLKSTESKDYDALFSNGARLDPKLPPRFGYYVGSLVAQEAARTRSLAELTKLGGAEVRPLVESMLDKLADCPSAA